MNINLRLLKAVDLIVVVFVVVVVVVVFLLVVVGPIIFLWWWLVVGIGTVIFMSDPTTVLRLCCGCVVFSLGL